MNRIRDKDYLEATALVQVFKTVPGQVACTYSLKILILNQPPVWLIIQESLLKVAENQSKWALANGELHSWLQDIRHYQDVSFSIPFPVLFSVLGLFLQTRKHRAGEQSSWNSLPGLYDSKVHALFFHYNILPSEALGFHFFSVRPPCWGWRAELNVTNSTRCQHVRDTTLLNLFFPVLLSPYGSSLCSQPWVLGRKRGAFVLPNAGNYRSPDSCSHLTACVWSSLLICSVNSLLITVLVHWTLLSNNSEPGPLLSVGIKRRIRHTFYVFHELKDHFRKQTAPVM